MESRRSFAMVAIGEGLGLVSYGSAPPSHAQKMKEGASFVTTERASGAGTVALSKAKTPRLAVKKSALWGGLLGAVKKKKETDRESLSTIDSLRRLEALLDKLDHGNMAQRVPRSPARELEHILGALNPIELGLVEPFRRFEAGVAAVEKQLMGRDTLNEEKLQRIRAVIKQTLEKGNFGTLEPLERDPPAPVLAPPAAAPSEGAPATSEEDASSQAPADEDEEDRPLTEAEERQQRIREREENDEAISELVYGSYERQGQRELLLGGLDHWLNSAADELEDALTFIEDTAQNVGGGQVEQEMMGRTAYKEQRDMDADLLIERGRAQLDSLLGNFSDNIARARTMHEDMAEQMRGKISALEIEMAELQVSACMRGVHARARVRVWSASMLCVCVRVRVCCLRACMCMRPSASPSHRPRTYPPTHPPSSACHLTCHLAGNLACHRSWRRLQTSTSSR